MPFPYVLLACLVGMLGQSAPPPPPQARPPGAAQDDRGVLGPEVISFDRIRALLAHRSDIFSLGPFVPARTIAPPPADVEIRPISSESVATFRAEIIALQLKSFEEDLKEFLAQPAPAVNAGFLDLYAGEHRAGSGPGVGASGSADVHPSALVDWFPRMMRRRAIEKARREVEAELQALLAAQKKAAEKPVK